MRIEMWDLYYCYYFFCDLHLCLAEYLQVGMSKICSPPFDTHTYSWWAVWLNPQGKAVLTAVTSWSNVRCSHQLYTEGSHLCVSRIHGGLHSSAFPRLTFAPPSFTHSAARTTAVPLAVEQKVQVYNSFTYDPFELLQMGREYTESCKELLSYVCVCVSPCTCYIPNTTIHILLAKWGRFTGVRTFWLVLTTSNYCLKV